MVAVDVDDAAAAAVLLHPPAGAGSLCASGRAYRATVITLLTATFLTLATLSQTGGRKCLQLHSTPGTQRLRLLPTAASPDRSLARPPAHQPHCPHPLPHTTQAPTRRRTAPSWCWRTMSRAHCGPGECPTRWSTRARTPSAAGWWRARATRCRPTFRPFLITGTLPEAMAFVHAHNTWVEGPEVGGPPTLSILPLGPRSHRCLFM